MGVGTGYQLHKIYKKFSPETKFLGVDIDKNYVLGAQELFKGIPNVEIRH